MRVLLLLSLVLVSGPAAAQGLRADEAALNEKLRAGVLPAAEEPENARLSAARAALALVQGRRDEATQLLRAAAEVSTDCALRARLAELGLGQGCAELRPGLLEPAILEPPEAFLIVAAGEDETGSAFPAAVLVTALKALAPAGGLRIESTADRFRVTGSAALEGLWYLDDRLLLSARSAPGRGRVDAVEALAAFLALRPPGATRGIDSEALTERPAGSIPVQAHGLSVELPASWSSVAGNDAWLAPGADPAEAFPPRAGAVAIKPRADRPELERRRNPLARRKRSGAVASPELSALPAGAKLLESRSLGGDTPAQALEWRSAAGGATRRALLRSVPVAGAQVLVIAHLGQELTTEDALRLLGTAQAARP